MRVRGRRRRRWSSLLLRKRPRRKAKRLWTQMMTSRYEERKQVKQFKNHYRHVTGTDIFVIIVVYQSLCYGSGIRCSLPSGSGSEIKIFSYPRSGTFFGKISYVILRFFVFYY
jgi:hypothetical protein